MMQSILEGLASVLPVVAIFCVLLALLVNIYFKIRRLIPVKVNCWFCNQWTNVQYDIRNSFECPTCLQYNGFSKDGDYNKPIPAHYDNLLNYDVTYNQQNSRPTSTPSNGLCLWCNNNLKLKVFQLANFVPLNENNYDVEIEHFEQQLEKSYKLCLQCENVVRTTLRKQNVSLGLKLRNLRKKGISLLNFNNYSKSKRVFAIKVISFILVAIALCNILYILSCFDFSNDNLRNVIPQKIYPYALKLKELGVNFQTAAIDFFNSVIPSKGTYVPFHIKKDDFEYNAKLLCCLGILLQILLLFLSESGRTRKFIQAAAWGLLIWLSWNYPVLNLNYNNYAQEQWLLLDF